MKSVGIVSYGAYVPWYRISLADIGRAWSKNGDDVGASLGIKEKAVASADEDAVTLAIEASCQCLSYSGSDLHTIGSLFVGSESHPYAVNPTSTIVGEMLGIGNNYLAADFEFACKGATAALEASIGLVSSGRVDLGLVVGTDVAQSKPHDVLEYASAAASAALLVGSDHVAAELVASTSYSSDTPDFWRRDGMRYPSHAGRFTGEPAYFTHVLACASQLLEKTHLQPSDISRCVFHMPNGKFPKDVAKRLGFSEHQLKDSLTVTRIGNPYAASSLVGLCGQLDAAKPGDTIFMVSYGSGAGSDGFLWKVTDDIVHIQEKRKKNMCQIHDMLDETKMIDYTQYLKQTHKI